MLRLLTYSDYKFELEQVSNSLAIYSLRYSYEPMMSYL
jgi:hypothetical protein